MMPDHPFPLLSPGMARERFLVRDESWAMRFRPDFDQFIVATLEYARPVIKLPIPPARTANHALFLVTDGQMDLAVGHSTYTLMAGTLAVVPALQIFSILDIYPDINGFMCFFSQETLLGAAGDRTFSFLRLTAHPLAKLNPNELTYVWRLFDRLMAEYTENGSGKTDLIRPYLLTLLCEINRVYVDTVPHRMAAGDRLLQRFMDLLSTRIRESRTVRQFADWLSVSPNHLNKVVRSRTGRSPAAWIDERLILEAKVWLFQSNLTVSQVAAALGFDDQANFGRLFRKYTQMSPTAFRAHCQRGND